MSAGIREPMAAGKFACATQAGLVARGLSHAAWANTQWKGVGITNLVLLLLSLFPTDCQLVRPQLKPQFFPLLRFDFGGRVHHRVITAA